MTTYGISTSAIGKGRSITQVFSHLKNQGYTGPVEIAIGPEPVDDPVDILSHDLPLTGHGRLPLGLGSIINPYTDFNGIVKASWMFSLQRYSMHPPTKKDFPTWDAFLMWAMKRHSFAHETGVPFSL